MTQPIPLPQLRPGQQGIIVRVDGYVLPRRRYLELGLVKGETVCAERVAPLGDPVAYRIKGYTLSLRREEAEHIHVVPLP
jgi:Fe2+ transport system protein FeoA